MEKQTITTNILYLSGRAFILVSIIAFISIYIQTSITPIHAIEIHTNDYGEHWIEVGILFIGLIGSIFVIKDEKPIL